MRVMVRKRKFTCIPLIFLSNLHLYCLQSLTRVFMLAAVLVMVSSAPAPAPFLDPVSIGAVSLGTAGGENISHNCREDM